MDTTIVIRHHNESFVHNRQRELELLGFATSLVTLEPGSEDVFTFDLYVDFDDAHRLTRRDDRWAVANAFFQRAENAENRRGQYARLATDWANGSGHSLQEALDQEHQAQQDYASR